MAINLFANQLNSKVALTTKTWAQLGFDNTTISIVYLLDPATSIPISTWVPNNPFSQLVGIEKEKAYVIQPKVNLDREVDFASPLPVTTTTTSTSTTSTTSTSTTTSSTTTTTTTVTPAFRYATAQDAIDIPNANVDDFLMTTGNYKVDGENSIWVQPSLGNTFTLQPCKKILIKGGNYDRIIIDNPISGTQSCPIIITNYDGQVKCKMFIIRGMKFFKATGKYDLANQTGDPNYLGHAGPWGYEFSAGTYGIFVDNQWTSRGNPLIQVALSYNVTDQPTNFELEFMEAGNGGFTNMIKSDNFPSQDMINVSIHDMYWHDIHGEGCYFGSTGGDPQHHYINLHFYNNRILRAGNDGIQFGQLSTGSIIERNVIHGAINWKSPFGEFQDNSIQYVVRNGDVAFRNNVVLGGAGINFFNYSYTGNIPSGFIDISNNVFLFARAALGGYFGKGGSNMALNVPIKFSGNYLGLNQFLYPEVYTDNRANNSPHLIRLANSNPIELSNNRWDGSFEKTLLYAIEGGSFPTINAFGNVQTPIPHPEFANYMGFPVGFDYLRVEQWASRIGATYGDESSFGYVGTKKGDPVIYGQDDYVMHNSKLFRSKVNGNSQIEPEVTANWQDYWELIIFTKPDSSTTTTPPDDVRLISTSYYNAVGAGLLDNPPYNGTTTTTTSSTTTTTTTATSLGDRLVLSVKDKGSSFGLKFRNTRAELINSPLFSGIGSSTLAGTGSSSYSTSLPALIQDQLSTTSSGLAIFANNALTGQDTFNVLETGNNPEVNENRNITMAIAANPTGIILSLPSNDIISGISPEAYVANMVSMYSRATSLGIPVFVISPQPRTSASVPQQQQIVTAYNLLKQSIPVELFVDVFNLLKDQNSTNPADIDPQYNADGIHVNDAGHQLIFDQLWSKINAFYQDPTFTQYIIQTGVTTGPGNIPASWTTFDTISSSTTVQKDYPRTDGNWHVYRVIATRPDSSTTIPSEPVWIKQTNVSGNTLETIQVDFSLDSIASPPLDWNNFIAGATGPTLNQSLALININQLPSGVTATVTQIFSGAGSGGSNAGIYPIRVTQDSWNIAQSRKLSGRIVLSGLSTSEMYDIDFYSSRVNSTGDRVMGIYIQDETILPKFGSLNADETLGVANNFNIITLKSVYPSAGGVITINVHAVGLLAYINAMVIRRIGNSPATTTTSTSSTSTSSTSTSSTSSTSSTTTTSTTADPASSTWTVQGPYFASSMLRVYTPAGYSDGNSNDYPTMLFFHGSGQTGSNIATILTDGLPQIINNGQSMKCIVICPQNPSGSWTPSKMKAAYDWAVANYRVDTNRVYATGLSLGATGTSDFVGVYASLVAAYVVSSGTYDTNTTPLNTKKNLPAWYHHGDLDNEQNTNNTNLVIQALNALSPRPKYPPLVSIYQGLAHSASVWNTNLYNKATAKYNFEDWLLLHNKDQDITAGNYLTKAETTLGIDDYWYAKRLIDAMDSGSGLKPGYLTRLTTLRNTIYGSNRRFVLDLGGAGSGGNINSLTTGTNGSLVSNLIDDNGSASTYGFTVVTQATPNTPKEGTSPGTANEYFGFPQEMYGDNFIGSTPGGTYKFTGLDNSKQYKLIVYPTKDTVSFNSYNTVTVIIGTTAKYLYANYNTTNWIEYDAVSPISGEITFDFKPTPIVSGGTPVVEQPSGAIRISTSNIIGYRAWNTYIAGVSLLEYGSAVTTTTTSSTTSTSTSSTSSTTTSTTTQATTTTTSTSTSTTTTTSTSTTTSTTSSTTTTTTTFVAAVSQFNLNATAQSTVDWIDVSGNPNAARIQVTDPATGIGIDSVGTATSLWNPAGGSCANNTIGPSVANPTFVFPSTVVRSVWYCNLALYSTGNENLFITGLIPGASYTIEMLGGRDGAPIAAPNSFCTYVCIDNVGTQRVDNYDIKNNTANLQTFSNKIPFSDGVIKLAVFRKSDVADGGMVIGYINGIRVTRVG